MTRRAPIPNWRLFLAPATALAGFVVLWESAVRMLEISPLILPSPSDVGGKLVSQVLYLLTQGGITLLESVLGFLLGGTCALILAIAFQFSRTAERAIYPYTIAVKAIPLVALAPIVVLWFGTGLLSKVVLAGIISFFPILVNAIQGLNATEPEALDLMETFSASKVQVLLKLRLPHALEPIFAGMKVSSTFAVVGAVVAEFVGSQSGIGYVIKSSSYYLDTDLTFAAIIVAALIGLSFFLVISLLERQIVFWRS